MPLSEPGQRRLAHYCRRAAYAPRESVYRPDGRHVPYPPRSLRQVIWADHEIRDTLLDARDPAAYDTLADTVPGYELDLLDLVTAVSLEAEWARPPA